MGMAMLPDLFRPRDGRVDTLGALVLFSGLEDPAAGYHYIRMDKLRDGAELRRRREEFAKIYSRAIRAA